MFRRTSFFELIKGDKGKNMVEQVKSTEYIDWLYDALARRNGFLNGELILYANDEKDAQNGALLSVFLMYVGDLISETDIENIADPAQCEVEKYLIQIKDKYFDICDLYGQGSVIFISELKEKPSSYFNLTP